MNCIQSILLAMGLSAVIWGCQPGLDNTSTLSQSLESASQHSEEEICIFQCRMDFYACEAAAIGELTDCEIQNPEESLLLDQCQSRSSDTLNMCRRQCTWGNPEQQATCKAACVADYETDMERCDDMNPEAAACDDAYEDANGACQETLDACRKGCKKDEVEVEEV
jgi:hypothetical protein